MRLEINFKIVLFGILFFVLKQIDIYIIFIISIIFHEIAHLLVGICVGLKPKVFSINPLGVSVEFYMYKGKRTLRKIFTYSAGPIFNLIVAIILLLLQTKSTFFQKIMYTNFLLAIFNLLPIMPLDGGKILKEILNIKLGNKSSNIVMNNITQAVLVIITVFYSIVILKLQNFAIFLLILYLWYLKYLEDKKVKIMLRAYEVVEKT